MTRKAWRLLPLASCPGPAFLLALALSNGAKAATFTVTNLDDSGPGSLRQAVLSANGAAGPDEVAFAPGLAGTITLTSGAITITDSLIVGGPGAGVLTVTSGSVPKRQIFRVESAAVAPIDATLSGLTLTGASASLGEGGAVGAYSENLTILDSVISDSFTGQLEPEPGAGCGGNVALLRDTESPIVTLRIVNSTVTGGNSYVGNGGNICMFGGRLILERSTVSGGSADQGGGLSLVNLAEGSAILFSTISVNRAEGRGGGIHVVNPFANVAGNSLLIESSTISGNSAGDVGGGIHLSSGNVPLLLRLTTLSNNSAQVWGGNLDISSESFGVHLDHSIVANGAPEDLAGFSLPFAVAADYSLIETPGVTITSGANNLIGVDPLLGPLADNGGPTPTHLPLPGSPVIDTGNPAISDPPPADQRGFARISGPAIDRGAVEVQQPTVVEVPALSPWAMLLLSALLFVVGAWRLKRDSLTKRFG